MKVKSIFACLLAGVLCVSLWGCGEKEVTSFDPATEGILNVVVFDEKTETLSYEVIDSRGNRQLTEEFELDSMTVLNAGDGCFQQTVVDGKTVNTVASVDVLDEEAGEQMVPDPAVVAIFNQTAALHDQRILALDILVCGGRYFPVVDLEAEGNTLVLLYHFNTETNTMTQLCAYDSVVIGGLQIPDPGKLP